LCVKNQLNDDHIQDELLNEAKLIRVEKEDLFRESSNCESLPEGNILGDNFVRDFYRYNCKSVTRYGSTHSDPMYRIDGMYHTYL
jgi:hypothetical protein